MAFPLLLFLAKIVVVFCILHTLPVVTLYSLIYKTIILLRNYFSVDFFFESIQIGIKNFTHFTKKAHICLTGRCKTTVEDESYNTPDSGLCSHKNF